MHNKFGFVLASALLSALPSSAAKVAIPVVAGANGLVRETRITLSNHGDSDSGYQALISSPRESRAWRDSVPAARAVEFSPPYAGLLQLDVAEGVSVDAWLGSQSPAGSAQFSRLPQINEYTRFAAASRAYFNGLARVDSNHYSDLAIVNLEPREAACTIAAFREDHSEIGGILDLRIEADSERLFADERVH